MSNPFIKIKVYAERTEWRFNRWFTETINEVEEIIIPVSRIVQIVPKNDVKCLVKIDTPEGIDTRWCVMSADQVMSLVEKSKDPLP